MYAKKHLRKLEMPFIITYVSLLGMVYILSRVSLEIYTDHSPASLWIWSLPLILPVSLYAAARTVFSKGEKWYGAIGYWVIYTLFGLFTSDYIIVNGDLLLSSAIKKETEMQMVITDVHRVFTRRTFDHTSVTLKRASATVVLEARPYAFYYLKGKNVIRVRCGRSFLGNDYASTGDISGREKLTARWTHLKDCVRSVWISAGLFALLIVAGFVVIRFSAKNETPRSMQPGFWKLLGIGAWIMIALALLLYAGLLMYVKFFTHAHL